LYKSNIGLARKLKPNEDMAGKYIDGSLKKTTELKLLFPKKIEVNSWFPHLLPFYDKVLI
jgi:hypothetical protein